MIWLLCRRWFTPVTPVSGWPQQARSVPGASWVCTPSGACMTRLTQKCELPKWGWGRVSPAGMEAEAFVCMGQIVVAGLHAWLERPVAAAGTCSYPGHGGMTFVGYSLAPSRGGDDSYRW